MIFGLDRDKIRQPHRLHKHKPKFTQDHGSLKEDKKFANRATRRRSKLAAKRHEEPAPEPKNSVRWNYW